MSDRSGYPSRRSLLGMALTGVAGNLPRRLSAAGSGDRILVCIYLLGGNDGNSVIVPLDGGQYETYARIRGRLALRAEDLLPVRAVKNPGEYGFHPALEELRDLYNRGVLGVVANVGSPRSGGGPPVNELDSVAFLAGGYLTLGFAAAHAGLTVFDTDRILTTGQGVSMVPLDGSPALHNRREIAQAAESIKFRSPFPPTILGRALNEVAGLIEAARSSGVRRALFTVPMGGFDALRGQAGIQPYLFRELSSAMAAFYAANEERGSARDVTTFTDSEFGRSLSSNAANGTGVGWGNHHLVMGGSVLGGDIYGTFPDMATAARDANGGWVPTTSHDQYLATLAGWAGTPYSELARAFPRLNGDANLGFLAY